jgi:retinol dehydrogenase-12
MALISYEAIFGAYTELYAGFSPDITLEDNGAWIRPWGRIGKLRQDILDGRSKEDGGTGKAEAFWRWSEEEVSPYI